MLQSLAGERSFARGEDYYAGGRVLLLSRERERLEALVRGSRTYRVQLLVVQGELEFSCTCPVGADRAFCKHCVAAGLAWMGAAEGGADAAAVFDLGALREFLARQSKSRLVDLLVEQAAADEELLQALAIEMAAPGGEPPNLAVLQRIVRSAFDPGAFLSGNGAADFARRLDMVVDTLRRLLDQGHAAAVIELAELALARGEAVLGQVDDSRGLSAVMEALEELHLAACEKAGPDPEALARRLFDWELRTDWDTFSGAAERYAGVLGPCGLALYRQMAQTRWDELPMLGPDQRPERAGDKRFRLASVMESLAWAAGDLEALVEVKSRDLSQAYRFLEIARLYREAGQADRALAWAEKGLRAFPRGTDSRLRTFLADEYHARGRNEEATALIWADFSERPELDRYRRLRAHAGVASWPEWRGKALRLLRALAQDQRRIRPPGQWLSMEAGISSLLVTIHLEEDDAESAWAVAVELGCSDDLWLQLAKGRERLHPEEAITVYQRLVESALRQGNPASYRRAVERLKQLHDLMPAQEWATYLGSIRHAHNRKRSFLRLLDDSELH